LRCSRNDLFRENTKYLGLEGVHHHAVCGTERVACSRFFGEVLRSLLTRAGVAAGLVVETAKRQGSDIIQSTIINELLDADLVIADLTDHNPNVLFELGLRLSEHKPVALIKASDTGRIFDVDNMLRVLEYNPSLWPSTLQSDVCRR
jgi:hypothetical protein